MQILDALTTRRSVYARQQAMRRAVGFTIVEIVVALVLIGIIAAVTMGRFTNSNAFNALAAQGQIISIIRAGQQSSLGREGVSVTLTPNASGAELTVELAETGGTIESQAINASGVSLSGDVNQTDSCEVTAGVTGISSASPMTIRFGELGDLDNSGFGAGTAVTSAVRVCINNDSEFSVCVSPAGFAYAGDCDA